MFGHVGERKAKLVGDIDRIDRLEMEVVASLEVIRMRWRRKKNLMGVVEQEEIAWMQRAKIKWLKEGDMNTSYFREVAKGRKSKNLISSYFSVVRWF